MLRLTGRGVGEGKYPVAVSSPANGMSSFWPTCSARGSMPALNNCSASTVRPCSAAISINVSPALIVWVCGVAVGPIGAGVGNTNAAVDIGVAVDVICRPRNTTVGLAVSVTIGAELFTHALNVAHSAAAALSAVNLSPGAVLTGTL